MKGEMRQQRPWTVEQLVVNQAGIVKNFSFLEHVAGFRMSLYLQNKAFQVEH